EEFLGSAVHVTDDGFGRHDPFAVEHQPQPENTVRGRVLRTDVEDHVGGVQTGPRADGHLALRRACGHGAHRAAWVMPAPVAPRSLIGGAANTPASSGRAGASTT